METTSKWKKRAKRDRKYRRLINLKNRLILCWLSLIDIKIIENEKNNIKRNL